MKRIYRSPQEKILAGILGGLGEMLSIDPTLVRLGFVFLVIATGFFPGVVAYLVGWLIIPESPDRENRSANETI